MISTDITRYETYRQISNISRTYKTPVGAAPTTSLLST